MSAAPRIGLIGANGHGRWHRRRIPDLAGIAEPAPIDPDPPVPPGTPVFTDHRELLARVPLDVVVLCTPPRTHLPIALDVLDAGCDLLLEKPPVVSVAEHETLSAALDRSGRVCQVGFQALGSAALTALTDAIADGRLGAVTGLATVASWQRDDAYYGRADWAGRQGLGDGALVNPLAHALMQGIAIAAAAGAGEPVHLVAERYRTRPIGTDDTAFARVTFAGGLRLLAAVTLAGEDFMPGEVVVTGTRGRAVLEYPTDRLSVDDSTRDHGRTDLLDNLLAHRSDPVGVPLLAPLSRTLGFTRVAAALAGSPEPVLLNGGVVRDQGAGPARVRVITGVNEVLRRAAEKAALPSELGVDWARPPGTESRLPTTAG
jgi:predicted dehydrogenase